VSWTRVDAGARTNLNTMASALSPTCVFSTNASSEAVIVTDSRLCLYGTCSPATLACECSAGWTHDVSVFWSQNCGMPTFWISMTASLGVVLGLAVVGGGGWLTWRRRATLRGAVQKATLLILLAQVLSVAGNVAALAQQATTPVGGLMAREFFLVSTKLVDGRAGGGGAILARQARWLKFVWPQFPILGGGPFLAGAAAGFAEQSLGDADGYNNAMIGMLCVAPLLQICTLPVLMASAQGLINMLDQAASVSAGAPATPDSSAVNPAREALSVVAANMRQFRNMAAGNAIGFVLVIVALVAVYFALAHHCVPYMFAVWTVLVISNVMTGANFFWLLRRPREGPSESEEPAAGGGASRERKAPAPGSSSFTLTAKQTSKAGAELVVGVSADSAP